MACQAHLGEVESRLDDIRAAGGELAAVTLTRPEHVAGWLRLVPKPYPVFSDPSMRSYVAFGLGRVPLTTLLRPGVLAHYLALWWRGQSWRRPYPGDDLLQLGGDFVIGPDGRLAFAFRGEDPGKRPAAEVIVDAVRRAVG
jgi:hypothetical protein